MNPNQNQGDPQKQAENKGETRPPRAEGKPENRGEQRRTGQRGERGFEGIKDMGGEEVEHLKEIGVEELDRLKQLGGESLESLREMGNDLSRRIAAEVQERPFAALGIAFGAGVVMSTLLTSKIGRLALLAGGGYVAKQMLADRMTDYDDEDLDAEETPRYNRGPRGAH